MSFSIPTFRQAFPEFVDPAAYTDAAMNFWAGIAGKLLPADRWDDMLDSATQLFVAHHLVVGVRNQMTADAGGVPGEVKGVLASKTVDKVSMSYDTKSVGLEDAGFWNASIYGVRFLQLARMFGAGGIQL